MRRGAPPGPSLKQDPEEALLVGDFTASDTVRLVRSGLPWPSSFDSKRSGVVLLTSAHGRLCPVLLVRVFVSVILILGCEGYGQTQHARRADCMTLRHWHHASVFWLWL